MKIRGNTCTGGILLQAGCSYTKATEGQLGQRSFFNPLARRQLGTHRKIARSARATAERRGHCNLA